MYQKHFFHILGKVCQDASIHLLLRRIFHVWPISYPKNPISKMDFIFDTPIIH